MPRGDKSKYTDKQEREADHIAESYESRGVPEEEAERRAWATVNKESGGGKKSGSGRGKPESHASSRKGGRLGGKASASRSAAARSASAKKAAAARKRKQRKAGAWRGWAVNGGCSLRRWTPRTSTLPKAHTRMISGSRDRGPANRKPAGSQAGARHPCDIVVVLRRFAPFGKGADGHRENQLAVSAAVGYEIAYKQNLGRLPVLPEMLPDRLRREGVGTLPISLEHAVVAAALRGPHRDPWDRIMMAQAFAEDCYMVTVDLVFADYKVPVLW